MKKNYILLFIALFELIGLSGKPINFSDSTFKKNTVWVGMGKIAYGVNRSISGINDLRTSFHSTYPTYSFGYERQIPLYKSLGISIGASYTNSRFTIQYTDFITPNVMNGTIYMHIRANRIGFPLDITYSFDVSNDTKLLLGVGAESFITPTFKLIKPEYINVYDNNGVATRNSQVSTILSSENFSPFRTLNLSGKLFINNGHGKRVFIGANYFLMTNNFPLQVKTKMIVGQKNFDRTHNLMFEGINLRLGYIW